MGFACRFIFYFLFNKYSKLFFNYSITNWYLFDLYFYWIASRIDFYFVFYSVSILNSFLIILLLTGCFLINIFIGLLRV